MAPAPASARGCGLPAFVGQTGERYYFLTDGPRLFSLTAHSDSGFVERLPAGVLFSYPGVGPEAWIARKVSGSYSVELSLLGEDGRSGSRGKLNLPLSPVSFTWAAQGPNTWLFFGGYDENAPVVAAFVGRPGAWRLFATLRGASMSSPRLDEATKHVILNRTEFADDDAPAPWIPASPERWNEFEVVTSTDGNLVALDATRARLWDGARWNLSHTPWGGKRPVGIKAIPGEGNSSMIAWQEGSTYFVAESKGGEWHLVERLGAPTSEACVDCTRTPFTPYAVGERGVFALATCYVIDDSGTESVVRSVGGVVARVVFQPAPTGRDCQTSEME